EAEYRVLQQDGAIELREYAPSIVAETIVDADFEDAGNRAFRKLFRYIDGENVAQQEIAMTAPVSQAPAGRKIEMTAPVGQRPTNGGWAVSFMMPSSFTMATIPRPSDPAVQVRAIPSYRAAVIRYSGFWSEERYREHLGELRAWIAAQGLEATGEPVWARYDPPFKPWFMRRNEVLIPVQ
ncbi:MAG TPA: heme-binding protein, partial [Xanthomonadales bacterium]|nr:heme-binding protein [Xanthomonadales bacterium]